MKIKIVERPSMSGQGVYIAVGCGGVVKIEERHVEFDSQMYLSYIGIDKKGNTVKEFVNGAFNIEYYIEEGSKQ